MTALAILVAVLALVLVGSVIVLGTVAESLGVQLRQAWWRLRRRRRARFYRGQQWRKP